MDTGSLSPRYMVEELARLRSYADGHASVDRSVRLNRWRKFGYWQKAIAFKSLWALHVGDDPQGFEAVRATCSSLTVATRS
jgi:hypothetical protein